MVFSFRMLLLAWAVAPLSACGNADPKAPAENAVADTVLGSSAPPPPRFSPETCAGKYEGNFADGTPLGLDFTVEQSNAKGTLAFPQTHRELSVAGNLPQDGRFDWQARASDGGLKGRLTGFFVGDSLIEGNYVTFASGMDNAFSLRRVNVRTQPTP